MAWSLIVPHGASGGMEGGREGGRDGGRGGEEVQKQVVEEQQHYSTPVPELLDSASKHSHPASTSDNGLTMLLLWGQTDDGRDDLGRIQCFQRRLCSQEATCDFLDQVQQFSDPPRGQPGIFKEAGGMT